MWFVYFAQRGHGFVKVGASGDPVQRVRHLRSKFRPMPVRLLGAVDRLAAGLSENAAHRALAAHRFAGEWYWPRPEVFAFIEDLLARHGLPDLLAQQRLPRLTREADLLQPVLV